jgi:fused signal recognition particle receptor
MDIIPDEIGSPFLFYNKKSVFMFGKKENDTEDNEEKGRFFKRLRNGLTKTRKGFTGRLDTLILGKREIDEDLLEELEEILFTSDLGVRTSQELIEIVREGVARKELDDPVKLKQALKENIIRLLDIEEPIVNGPGPGEPLVIMVIGVNGVGKTTTIGKIAHIFREKDKAVMMVAADTFRAAAVEQLTIWGERTGSQVIRQGEGADPSAVVFDAVEAAVARKMDVVLIDTAGRLHTKVNLMDELRKIHRVAGKKLHGAPHQVWLVLDATTGQNAVSQAEMFHEALGVNGIILTKLDGTAKGGIVIGISRQIGLPIKYIGIGEKVDDLRPFNPVDFVEAIFSE